jgi:hypothetical protein
MSTLSGGNPGADLRDYLAEERTFLAWIRTGLALTGFGFVVARFGLFLEQVQIARGGPATQPHGLSHWFGRSVRSGRAPATVLGRKQPPHGRRRLSRGTDQRERTDNPLQPEWGFAWPANRRVMYNRASADPDGRPWSERKKTHLVGRGAAPLGWRPARF